MDPDAARSIDRVPHGSTTASDVIDFSANTNPRTPDGTRAVYVTALETARSYPPEPPSTYRAEAAMYVGCDPEDVVPTPGGLAAIRLAIGLAIDPGDTVLVPRPSFGEYAREVRLHGADPEFVDANRILEADPAEHGLAIVCTPNNPTGTASDPDALRSFARQCREADTLLLVDEAFLDFTDRPSMAGAPGVVVARSLTKMFGLPGLRVGFAVARGAHGEALAAARRPWNVGAPALAVGTHAMRQREFVTETRRRVAAERERMRTALEPRFGVSPSDAPFLLLDAGDRDVDDLLAHAREAGLVLRDARTFGGLGTHVRVAVRLPAENDRLLEVLGRD